MTTSAKPTDVKRPAACLIGWPAAHSRSPLIHHYWLRTLGIEGGYNIEAVPPEGFAEFILHLSAHGFVGANVTVRTRSARWRCRRRTPGRARSAPPTRCGTTAENSARPTPTSKALSIISTPARRAGTTPSDALVLGAGGAARAVVFGLLERGIKRVHLANRTIERAQALADQFGAARSSGRMGCDRRVCCRAPACWSTPPRSACTASRRSRSMSAGCSPDAVVADLVYVPLQTPLLRGGAGARIDAAPTGSACCCTRRCAASNCGSDSVREVTPELRALVEADLTKV